MDEVFDVLDHLAEECACRIEFWTNDMDWRFLNSLYEFKSRKMDYTVENAHVKMCGIFDGKGNVVTTTRIKRDYYEHR